MMDTPSSGFTQEKLRLIIREAINEGEEVIEIRRK